MSGKAAEHPETQDLTRGPIARQIVTLAAPIIGTSFIQVAYSFTDMAYSHGLPPLLEPSLRRGPRYLLHRG